jgi:hypothetical protein
LISWLFFCLVPIFFGSGKDRDPYFLISFMFLRLVPLAHHEKSPKYIPPVQFLY